MDNIPAIALPSPRDRHEFLSMRRGGLGSSDASAIVGLSAYESPYTVWEDKTGRAPLDVPVDSRRQEIMDWGNILEPVILQEVAQRLDLNIDKPEHGHRHAEYDWLRCNLDGWSSDQRIAEIKTTHVRNEHLWEDDVPDHPAIQVHHAALVTKAERAIVACLVGGQRLIIHEIEINNNILEMLWETEDRFWTRYVERDTPPPVDGHVATMDALTREWAHKPGDAEVHELDIRDHWEAWHYANEREREMKAAKREAAANIAALMNGHDRIVTDSTVWAAAQRGQLIESRLKNDHADLYEKYVVDRPAFDRESFKKDHPELFAEYQAVSIRPKKIK